MQIDAGIWSAQKNKQFNLNKKLAKKWFGCRRWSIQSNNIGLQQGNGLGMDDVNMEMD